MMYKKGAKSSGMSYKGTKSGHVADQNSGPNFPSKGGKKGGKK